MSVHDFIRLIPNACFRLQAREQQISDLDTEVSQLQQQVREHEENALKRDKAIQGLVAALVQKDEQVATRALCALMHNTVVIIMKRFNP